MSSISVRLSSLQSTKFRYGTNKILQGLQDPSASDCQIRGVLRYCEGIQAFFTSSRHLNTQKRLSIPTSLDIERAANCFQARTFDSKEKCLVHGYIGRDIYHYQDAWFLGAHADLEGGNKHDGETASPWTRAHISQETSVLAITYPAL